MASVDISVKLADMDRFRMLVWELRQLEDEMRVSASPHADRLERLLDRFTADIDEDRS